ncbi:TPA: hypothetical protein ACPWIL_002408 [Pseudomonas aeruginosa]|uniref:hypothetical protein n=1 Tax=Pseudomonas aeruginosa TaxID=287 RepID=UPI00066628AF|nr:hypothetical protein [Pseudomonas aeruginosa]MBI7315538.1 hypothetical protein [Pseudomonas aeruginosa]MBI7327842.1 hypothetical protein [Pseudomonas aeruginosa]MBI7496113.1 hypothetical protein [Pseudomonas aeruginosa]NYU28494.1 hypothetical protein [Pseudomonas aeruginosa]RPM99094.1 hypothetical protein IPC1285_03805 [Pseudomonas aeruginosa]
MSNPLCACCGQPFEPRPQVPNQTYCSSPDCQRTRKLRWQQDKLHTDPDYRDNQRDAQRAWFDRHPGYWRDYRSANTGIVEPEPPPSADDTGSDLAKMDVSILPPGLYQLQRIGAESAEEAEVWLVEIRPVAPICSCKKDVCKEMT